MAVHLDQVLTDKGVECYLGLGFCDSENDLDGPAPAYVLEIFEMQGVDGTIWIDRYKIRIHKATLFSWDELAPKIVEKLRCYLDPEGSAVEIGKPIRRYLGEAEEGARKGG